MIEFAERARDEGQEAEEVRARPMRILHVVSSLDPRYGGPAAAVWAMVRYGPEGYENEVVTLDDPASIFLRESGVRVHVLGPPRFGYCYTPELVRWLKANRDRFDGVVVNGMWQHCGYAVWRTMRGRVPYLVFPHGMLDPYFKRASAAKHMKKWLYWLAVEYWVLRGARLVLFTSETESEQAKQSFWLHRWVARVIPYGAVPPPGEAGDGCDPESAAVSEVRREAFFAACPAVRARRFLLFLGRIDPKKGCDLLMDAFVKLAGRYPDLDLVMAGPDAGNWRAELIRRAEPACLAARIHWPGMLQGDAKWGAFHACEAFVLPSHQENFGVAVAEALACGRPVLLSDKVNIAAEIARAGAGMIEVDTAVGVERLLERWIDLPAEERVAMARCARECFLARYDMRKNAKAIARLFEKDNGY
jgi:glycosyltransferase involved in cell wall biosynthesis